MKHTALVLSGVVLTMMVSSPASASTSDDYLQEVVTNLEDARVYVAPGIPGTDENTASELDSRLDENDNITLVMLPSEATESVPEPLEFLQQLSENLGNNDIIGLTIGDDAYAYASPDVLPKGKASDLMQRADSIATDDTQTMETFTRITHQWIVDHPEPNAPGSQDSSFSVSTIIAVVLVLIAMAIAYAYFRRKRPIDDAERVALVSSPESVKRQVERILELRQHIYDPQLQSTLLQCSRDIESYFARYTRDPGGDGRIFRENLGKVVEVLEKYIDVQNNDRYYYSPQEELQRGAESIEDFASYVLKSCRNGSRAQLHGYTVNTQILQAQSLR